MVTQETFDKFVQDYNEDYMYLLTRASMRHYECLISSWLVLKDLYNVIVTIYDQGSVIYRIMPHPFSFRGNDVLL
ncbi:MAG TPA: hypothetical protein VNO70_22175, partial [Blastocatellia bacterium]|nr:hypothetical protein [Blastocatellia bacterium]